jgi:hypothetical protein
MTTINLLEDVVVGDYGVPLILTIVDRNGVAVDVSAYTSTKTVFARDPSGIKSLSFSASFVTNGADGKVQFQPASNNTFDRIGNWDGQVKLTTASAVIKTILFTIQVKESLG